MESLLLYRDYGTQVWGLTPNVFILSSSIKKEKKALFSNFFQIKRIKIEN